MSNSQTLVTPPSTKPAGPVAQAWALWEEVAGGEVIPRSFGVDLAVAAGINPATARTQMQRWLTHKAQQAA